MATNAGSVPGGPGARWPVERGVQRCDKRGVDLEIVEARPLVAELAFDPEHAEVVAEDRVEIVARLIIDPERVVGDEVHWHWRQRSRRHLSGAEADVDVGILVPRRHDAALDAEVQRAVARGGRSGDDRSGCSGRKQ